MIKNDAAQAAYDHALDAEDDAQARAANAFSDHDEGQSYSEKDLDKIFTSFKSRHELPTDVCPNAPWRKRAGPQLARIADQLEGLAWIYKHATAATVERPPPKPSASRRQVCTLVKRLQQTSELLQDPYRREELRRASILEAKRAGLPGFEAQLAFLTNFGESVDRQIAGVHSGIQWLAAAVDVYATQKLPPAGNRDDPHLRELVLGIDDIYQTEAADPRDPYYDSMAEEERGELLDLLNACLRPLGVNKSFSALRSLLQRVKKRS